MKLELTEQEYRALLDMLYISDWVMHAHSADLSAQTLEHRKLRQKVLAQAHASGMTDIVEHIATEDAFNESEQYEQTTQDAFIAPYNDNTFWTELVHRLAARDVVDEISDEAFDLMAPAERMDRIDQATEPYRNEFSTNGLENVRVVYNRSDVN